jgi:23S rRNA (adenine2503-C2)-methyltransferase
MIKQPDRMTLCVSSQVGCAMGCGFCRTATMGLRRHLTTAEIIQQVMGVIVDAKEFGDMFTNIVFMGMGEPLHNYDNLKRALEILHDVRGLGIGPRRVTISTSGLLPALKRFGAEGMKANIAISLNATTDATRSEVMPINRRYPLAELIEAIREYPLDSRKRITVEYVMLHGLMTRRMI